MSYSDVEIRPGKIYILRNPMLKDGLVKIGYTQTTSEGRAEALSKGSGVPFEFEVMFEEDVADCKMAERIIHNRLDKYRVNNRREFFKLPMKTAARTVLDVCHSVNCLLLGEKGRLSIWIGMNGLHAAQELKNLLSRYYGGDTSVYLVYQNQGAQVRIRLSDSANVQCSAELLAALKREPWVEDISLSLPLRE